MKVGKESEKLEFKKSTGELKEGVISITAILNKHSGGELYFGVMNNGTPIGQMIGENTLRDVSQAIASHIQPQIYPKISEVIVDNKRCIYVEFSGDNAPYFAYGRGYIRVADEDKQMSPAEMEDYIARKIARNDTWDSSKSDFSPEQLDEAVLKDYLERANQAERISFEYSTRDDMLARLELVVDNKLKNAAVAMFRGFSLLEVQMAIFATTEKVTFNDISRSGGNITQLVSTAERYIRNNIRWRVEFDGSLQRKEIPEIPINAIREAIFNSYCHRDYNSSQNNEVIIFSDRIEIYNPGTFPLGLTPEDFINGTASSIKRNPLLAQLMYYVKDIESFGTGIKRIHDACVEAGVKVEFEIRKMGFAVVFYRPEIHSDKSDVANDVVNVVNEPVNEPVNELVNEPVNELVNELVNEPVNEPVNRQEKMLAILIEKKPITVKKLSERTGISQATIKREITALTKSGKIRRVGSDKSGYWEVIE